MPIRVAVVEDRFEILNAVCTLFEESDEIALVGRYETGEDALVGMAKNCPDIALIDLGLPGISGIEVIKTLCQWQNNIECIVFTVEDDDEHLFSALQAGANGFIVKTDSVSSKLIDAIHETVAGGAAMSLGIARRVLNHFKGKDDLRLEKLTSKERSILESLSHGYSTKKIANDMNIAYDTVRTHQKNIYKKLQVGSMLEAVAIYRDNVQLIP